MELKNKRVSYIVTNSNDTVSITGTVNIDNDSYLSNFNGEVLDANGTYQGSFYYNRNENLKISKNINEVIEDLVSDAESLINETISEIKEQLIK